MDPFSWSTAAPAIAAAFLASLVEVVEAFTIVLAVAAVRGIRPAVAGATAGLLLLALLVLALGPMLDQVPIHLLQLVIGILLLLFGMRWLRKAILRAGGLIALHDEEQAFTRQTAQLQQDTRRDKANWMAGLAAFKAVVLEGLEVVFIVIAVGAGRNLLIPASMGALAACVLVFLVGVAVHRPLSRVPENTLKFGVGAMLTSFGMFWSAEGAGASWPGKDAFILALLAGVLLASFGFVSALRRRVGELSPALRGEPT
jgi:uncharacterized membrane protein